MSFIFRPALMRDSILFELPRPIRKLRVLDAWDFEQMKVPLADGDSLVGHSQQGVDISLEGQIGTHEGALKTSEEEMLIAIEDLRDALDVAGSDDKYDFFLYYDDATATYRRFSSCSTVRFEYDLSEKQLFTYSLVIHADDPILYTTKP